MESPLLKPHVVIEGPDGSGKSALVGEIVKQLNTKKFRAVATREPGGWNMAVTEALRDWVIYGEGHKDPDIAGMSFLIDSWAAYQKTRKVLETHAVIQDRSVLSRLVYQSGKSSDVVTKLFVDKCPYLKTAWTLYLRTDPELIVSRKPMHLRDELEHNLENTIQRYDEIVGPFRELCDGAVSALEVKEGQSLDTVGAMAIDRLIKDMPGFREFYES